MLIPYRSVRTPCRKETEIKKSIFIAQLFPVETEEEAQSILETVRKKSQRCGPPLLGMAHRHRPHP